MTRESVPRFDLYAELEVSRSAARETIEAAHRAMAKRHHPDVAVATGVAANAEDAEARIKRINVARDWLLDPERRARYDRALRRREGGPAATGDFEAAPGRAAWTSFGPNADRVREFLAQLRDVDERRAHEIRDGRNAIDADDYAHARRAAFAISRSRRLSEWLFARDAAAGVILDVLGNGPLERDVGDILAEIAGAIAVRDLLPATLFDTLIEPWTYRGRQVAARASRPPITMSTVPMPGASFGAAAGPPRAATPASAPVAARATTPPPAPVAAPTPQQARASEPARAPSPPRPPRPPLHVPRAALPILAASSAGLIVVATLIGASSLFHPFTGGVAGIQASGGNGGAVSAAPTLPAGGHASQGPATTPSPSQPQATTDPQLIASLQQNAASTIAKLEYDQAQGLVKPAQKLLGGTAPGLTAWGLSHATFPDVRAKDIVISGSAGAWIGTIGPAGTSSADTLSSIDGVHWAFDYGARSLDRFGQTSKHTLYFLGGSGVKHEVQVRITSAIVTTTEIVLNVVWTYGPDGTYGNDGPYFDGTTLEIGDVTVDGVVITNTNGLVSPLGTGATSAKVRLLATITNPGSTAVDIQVVNGGEIRGFTTIDAEVALRR